MMAQHSLQKSQLEDGGDDIAALYDEAIEATIAQCKLLQNAKVLAAIEKQWRQSLRRKQAELRRAAAAHQNSATEKATQSSATRPENCESLSSTASVSTAATEAAPATARNVGPPPFLHGGAESGSNAYAATQVSAGETEEPKAETSEDTDDEFADAEVDEAEEGPSVLGARVSLEGELKQQQQQQEHPPSGESATNGNAQCQQSAQRVVREKTAQQENSDEDNEEGAGMTLDDVSDLDDREPPTTDGIFAFYEKVERAAAGSARRSSKWKALLRHGILRVGGREIPFDRITGEFSF